MPECRVCLVENVRMHLICNTRYKEMFEKLSGTKLSTENGMPDTVCFICNSHLQKFCKFFDMSQKTEKILKKRLLGCIEMSKTTQSDMKLLHNLTMTSTQSMSYVDNGEATEPEVTVTIKEEPIDFEEEQLKVEYLDSPPVDEMLHDDGTSMKSAPMLGLHLPEETPTEPNKPTLWAEFSNMDNKNEVFIKTETTEAENEDNTDITQSLLRNLSMAFEGIPLKQPSDLEYFPKNTATKNRECKYYCSLCSYKTHTARALRMHTKVHNPSYPYACDFCSYRFISEKKLSRHRDYCTVCSICGKKFSNINGLRTHVRLHTGIQPYYCDSCGRGFNQKSNLQTHMRVHSRDKQYPCEICNKTFPFKSFLERHTLLHGADKLDMESIRRILNCHKLFARKKKNAACVCSACGRILQSSAGLALHMRLHTGERPFSCEICSRVFIQKYNLLTHIERVHAGVKLLSCKVCRKMFTSNSEMKQHFLSHTAPLSDHTGPLSDHTRTLSDYKGPLSDHTGPLSGHTCPLPDHTGPRSGHKGPLLDHTEPLLDHKGPLSGHTGSLSDHREPLSDNPGPLSDYKGPLSGNTGPLSDHGEPPSDYPGPLSDYKGPLSNHTEPLSDYKGPLSDYKEPLSDYKEPLSDYKGPRSGHKGPRSARDFEMFQQKHIYMIHKTLHSGQLSPYACDMCRTRILSY